MHQKCGLIREVASLEGEEIMKMPHLWHGEVAFVEGWPLLRGTTVQLLFVFLTKGLCPGNDSFMDSTFHASDPFELTSSIIFPMIKLLHYCGF